MKYFLHCLCPGISAVESMNEHVYSHTTIDDIFYRRERLKKWRTIFIRTINAIIDEAGWLAAIVAV